MSALQPLQDRVLEVLNHHGSLPVKDLRRHIADVSAEALDCAVNALQRSNKLTRALGWYDLVREPKGKDSELKRQPKAPEVTVILAPSDLELQLNQKSDALDLLIGTDVTPPTAAEEAESSLAPIEAAYELIDIQVYKQTCIDCENSFPITEFQLIGPHKTRARRCPACHGKRSAAGIAAHKVKRLKGEPLAAATSTLVSDSLHTANGSPSSNSSRTPTQPQWVYDPPATSSDTSLPPPANGTSLTDVSANEPEALSPVGAGPIDPGLSVLAQKRAALIAKQELLHEEYVRNTKVVADRIDEIDGAIELVRRLCEETE